MAAYRFVPLHDLSALRQSYFDSAWAAGIKGTVLLAEEGINLVLAGPEQALRRWWARLLQDPRFTALQAKESFSAGLPFVHLRVKIKAEIIRMNQPTISPAAGRAPSVSAATLARWLSQGFCDAGRPLAVLDTRNGFEVDAGAFAGCIDWRLNKFSDFPAALAAHQNELLGKTVVSYCTGGIRCEKAALWMAQAGVADVFQLDGGVLKYFEQTQSAPHFAGACFVFDQRGNLNTELAPISA